jgi:hypothetical protein
MRHGSKLMNVMVDNDRLQTYYGLVKRLLIILGGLPSIQHNRLAGTLPDIMGEGEEAIPGH